MHRKYSPSKTIVYSLAAVLGLFVCGLPTLTLASFSPPSGRGLPGRREPGGTRSACIQEQALTLTSLTPEESPGLTVSEYPTFFWYLPKSSAEGIEFALKDKAGKELYRTVAKVTGQPGIISLTLPANAGLPPLQVGQDYNWTLNLICDFSDRSGEPSVEGWVQRIAASPELSNQLKKATPQEVPGVYASAGIWYEAITTLAELRRNNPTDRKLTAAWSSLLKDVKLDKVATAPFVECCKAGSNEVSSLLPEP